MLLTFNIQHGRDFSAELAKARDVAKFAQQTRSLTSKDVKSVGLPSAIVNQILRKYSHNHTLKSIRSVVLTVPAQSTRLIPEARMIRIACLKLDLDINYLPKFDNVNQIEVDRECAHVTVTINEPPLRVVD